MEIVVVIAYDPSVVAEEHVLESRADRAVQGAHVVGCDAFSVRRVGDKHSGWFRSFFPLGDGAFGERYVLVDACAFGIFSRYFECALLYVGTDDGYFHGAFGAVVVVYLVEEVGVEVGPCFKGELLAVYAGGYVGGNQGGFDKECA